MGHELLPKLRDLGARSVDDLQFLEPEDFADLDLAPGKRHRLTQAVLDVKRHVAGRARPDRREKCVLS